MEALRLWFLWSIERKTAFLAGTKPRFWGFGLRRIAFKNV